MNLCDLVLKHNPIIETQDQDEGKKEPKVNQSTLNKTTNSIFRKWALSKAEHPRIDKTKKKDISSMNAENKHVSTTFTQKEKDIVAKFLDNVKSDLHRSTKI